MTLSQIFLALVSLSQTNDLQITGNSVICKPDEQMIYLYVEFNQPPQFPSDYVRWYIPDDSNKWATGIPKEYTTIGGVDMRNTGELYVVHGNKHESGATYNLEVMGQFNYIVTENILQATIPTSVIDVSTSTFFYELIAAGNPNDDLSIVTDVSYEIIPEPSSLVLFVIGVLTICLLKQVIGLQQDIEIY